MTDASMDERPRSGHPRARRRVLTGLLLALALAVAGWTGGVATAEESDGSTVDEMLGHVARAAQGATSDELVPVGVLIDDNGALPGGLRTERVEVPADRARVTIDALESLDEVRVASTGQPVSIASDPLRPQQYGVDRIRANRLPGHLDATGVTVAVIDTGVSGNHPDLQPLLPDGRQRVATGVTYLTHHPHLEGTPGNVDPHGHGTHAAGVVAAARDNGVGVAGLAPGAQILPVRALDAQGQGNTLDVADGIYFAHLMGADVISLSLSGPGNDPYLSSALAHVTTDWSRGKPPTVVVAAAGNAGVDSPVLYPAGYSSTIAVGASNSTDRVAAFSSRGNHLNVAAPGVNIVSTWPVGRGCQRQPSAGYCSLDGTSMATPHVAAVAALLRSREPGLTPAAVRHRLESTAHDIATLGRDRATGAGRVDAAAAVLPGTYSKVPRVYHAPTGAYGSVRVEGRRITVRGRATDREGPPRVRVRSTVNGRSSVRDTVAGSPSSGGNWTLSWNDVPGTHRVCVNILDNPFGNPTALGCREAVVK